MANALAFIGKRIGVSNYIVKRFTATLSGSYANGGAIGVAGETITFNKASNTGYRARPKLPSGGAAGTLLATADFDVTVQNGYTAQIEQNAAAPNANNYILRIFYGGSGNANPAELANGTYASYGLTGAAAVVLIEARVPQKSA